MKKHLIAAAVAGALAVPAMAQVTVSGTLDIAVIETRKATDTVGATSTSLKSSNTGEASGYSTSTLNFSGSEDLGGGLKAGFFWNQTINADSGEEGAREGYITLDGGFGQFKLGRFVPAGEATLGGYVTGTTLQFGTVDAIFNYDGVELGRQGGNIQYTTPNMGGISLVVGYNDGSDDDSTVAGKNSQSQIDVAIKYSAGPLGFGLSHTMLEADEEGDTGFDIDLTGVGASYNLGAALIKLSYLDYSSKVPGATVSDVTTYQVGVTVPLGALSVYANYHDGEDKGDGQAGTQKVDLSGYQVGAIYSLSKRTSLYAVIGQDEAKVPGVKGKQEGSAVGVRHSF